jgi:hypothetical protein
MRKWTEKTGIVLLILLGLLWVGAKVHFFMRYGYYSKTNNLSGYLLEHWPFWAGAGAIALLLYLLGAAGRRKSG